MSDSTPQRNVIALLPEACTVHGVRECPSWCCRIARGRGEREGRGVHAPSMSSMNSLSTTACDVLRNLHRNLPVRRACLEGCFRLHLWRPAGLRQDAVDLLAGGLPVVNELNGKVEISTLD